MFLLISGSHVGADLDVHQHGVSIQISINLSKKSLHIFLSKNSLYISFLRKLAVTWILVRVVTYVPSFFFQILHFSYGMVLISILIYVSSVTPKTRNWQWRVMGVQYQRFRNHGFLCHYEAFIASPLSLQLERHFTLTQIRETAHQANWPAVRTLLPSWVNLLVGRFSYQEAHFK